VRRISFEPVHSGLKIAFVVNVITFEGASVRTPFEGSVKGVQCAFVVVVGLAKFQICLASIAKLLRACRCLSKVASTVGSRHLVDVRSPNSVLFKVRDKVQRSSAWPG
jgi:hypothetical protein